MGSPHFKKTILSSCVAALSVAVLASPAIAQNAGVDGGSVEEIVVTGIRGSQKAAVDVKRNSAVIVDSIVAEDIGKLPDVTIADSLQRVSGVQIDREAGEGSSLNVRGMPQVLTTLNGEAFLSPWSLTKVSANYSDIPASMVAGVDVIKSQSASTAAGGISGVIDLKTRRALDMEQGWTGTAALETSEGSITKDANHDVNAFVAWNNGDLGFTFGAFSSLTNAANYQMYEDSRLGFVNAGGDPLDLNGDGNTTTDRYLVPAGYGVKAYVMEREREGFATSFQSRLSDSLTFTGEVFYTKMDQYDRGVETQFNGSRDSNYDVLRPGSVTTKETVVRGTGNTPDRVINSLQVAVVEAPDFQATTKSKQNHTDAINSNFELAFDSGEAFKGSVRYIHAEANRKSEEASFQQGTPAWYWIDADNDGVNDPRDPFLVTVDYTKEYPTFTYGDDLSSIDRLNLFQAAAFEQKDEATMDVLRADGSYEFEVADFKSFDFGVRVDRRDVKTTKSDYMTPTGRYSTWADPAVPEELQFKELPGDYVWQRYPDWYDFKGNADMGQAPFDNLKSQLISYNDFGPFNGFESGVAALNPKSLDNVNGFMNSLYPGATKFADPAKAYSVVEDSASIYFQGNFENDQGLFGIPYAGNLGLRVVETKREVVNSTYAAGAVPAPGSYYGGGAEAAMGKPPAGWQVMYKQLGTKTTKTSFTDVLPAANISFFPTDDVIVRFGYNKTMSQNDLVNVGEDEVLWYQEYKVYTPDGTREDAEGKYNVVTSPGGGNHQGNPNVKPWRADNWNASAEWYFAEGSILGIGVFLIQVDTATETLQEARTYPDSDGVVRRTANVWTTQNVSASDLAGFEVGYKQSFDFLPGIFGNTGVEFNYTYSDSDSGDEDLEGKSFPLQSNSEHQYNAILWYQGEKLSSRIAYNWRSDIFQGRVGLNTNEAPISMGNWTEAAGYLDVSVNYDVIDNVTVYVQGTNLTETNYRNYAQFENQFHSLSVQERRIAAGIRVRL
ncbi:TonB-dependent receptor [Cellvibrio polysaccharolyticus]|uniref:TonB-dependent receptor n=1 Tax=Cellvibrio polysaccharolyticus TaxID=2082724 RepID=A0A928V3P2_9GAMM|nr:TonB-dependent receptor [Cellvibrio polysaccharolyticus]MBE8717697.1 TonB-dependent receptor [Cellvibrio polysaccharolyticus]